MDIPKIIYGTAWKKDQTADLVTRAITAGFRGIDTAAQPKHYNERGVGDALKRLEKQGIARHDIFIQTKFTPISGQDPSRIPYNPQAPLGEQVNQSLTSSLENLGVDFIDSLVLHSPLSRWKEMMEVWTAMEKLCSEGRRVRMLGISNCYDLAVLKNLHAQSQIKPTFVQNRFYAETDYDSDLRSWCMENGVTYQSFWTLTANPHILRSARLHQIAHAHQKTEAQIFFRSLSQIGIIPLTGTQSETHMKEDLEIFKFSLSEPELEALHSTLQSG